MNAATNARRSNGRPRARTDASNAFASSISANAANLGEKYREMREISRERKRRFCFPLHHACDACVCVLSGEEEEASSFINKQPQTLFTLFTFNFSWSLDSSVCPSECPIELKLDSYVRFYITNQKKFKLLSFDPVWSLTAIPNWNHYQIAFGFYFSSSGRPIGTKL